MPQCWWRRIFRFGHIRLDFVKNQDSSCFVACLAKCLHECRSGNLNAAYSLDAFDDDGTYVTFGQFGLMASVSFSGR